MQIRFAVAVLSSLPALLLSAAGAQSLVLTEESEQAHFELMLLAEGLRNPSSIAFTDRGDALISGWYGDLWRIVAGRSSAESIPLDLALTDGRGLRTVSPHPSFADNGYLYFCFATGSEERNQTLIARGRLLDDEVVDVQTIFSAENFSKGLGHQSCKFHWESDSTMLVPLGDRFHHKERAQSRADYYGVVVRLNDDGTPAATTLAERHADTKPGVWSYGHRNIQGMARDPFSGEVWAHEHGPYGGDEVNRLSEGGNYGWPAATFGIDYDMSILSETPLLEGTVPPVFYWYPSIAPSGMAVYSGDEFPKWRGDLFLGGLGSQRLHRLERLEGRVIREELLLSELDARIRDVVQSPDGSLYVLTDEENGRVFEIRAAAPAAP